MDACLIHDAARPERVMSDVVSIADLMRPSNYLAAKGQPGEGAAAKEELLGGPGRGPTLLARQATCIFLTMRQTMTTTTTTCNMGPQPQPQARYPIPQTERNPNPTPITAPALACGRGGRLRGGLGQRQASKQAAKRHISTASQQRRVHQSICSSVTVDCARCERRHGTVGQKQVIMRRNLNQF